jgi:hypothetical protein
MDVITVSLLAIIIFAVSVAVTAFFLKSVVDVHNRTVDLVLDKNSSYHKDIVCEESKKEEK